VYRVAELSGGFTGELANDEISFMILEGPMIIIATFLLTVFHPGVVFRGGNWEKCDFPFRKQSKDGETRQSWWGKKASVDSDAGTMLERVGDKTAQEHVVRS